ncbi:MAG: flagellar filament capping protein FliD [Acetatifactor sp.]|nr:flagellar filament capping protein FliD [Acetatifactor sp.]
MATRVTGMISGMDTQSMIEELVAAKHIKVDNAEKSKTKLSWKQDIWKELNTSLKSLQTKYVANMRFSTAYLKKTTTVSNSNYVSVLTGDKAVNSVQSMTVNKLAKTGYLTGAEIADKNGDKLTALSTMDDLGVSEGAFTITGNDGKVTNVSVSSTDTIADVLEKVKGAGINASFDANNQRIFISASTTGYDADFSVTADNASGDALLSALGIKTDVASDTATKAAYKLYSDYQAGDAAAIAEINEQITNKIASEKDNYVARYKTLQDLKQNAENTINTVNEKYGEGYSFKTDDEYKTDLETANETVENLEEQIKTAKEAGEDTSELEAQLETAKENATKIAEERTAASNIKNATENLAKYNEEIAEIETYVDITDNGDGTYSGEATEALTNRVQTEFADRIAYGASVYESIENGTYTASNATKVAGQDAEITLNNATFNSTTNVFEINGLTITALNVTPQGEEITVTTKDDTQGIYDMIKGFLKEYNTIINKMDSLYNAASAKDYEPLTKDEKAAMNDSEVEEWEKKIKDALLRKDSDLSSIMSSLKGIMSSGIEVGEKTMFLSDFGINTLGYFEAPDNEKNAYHIDGDEDDSNTSGKTDKLLAMISSDPDTVVDFFSTLAKNLHQSMSDMSSSVEGYRSYGSFYNDKKLTDEVTSYDKKIKDLEEKLADYEDKWYKKFAAMEKAMAKMQSSTTALAGLLGGQN